jgi:hypothetical protein
LGRGKYKTYFVEEFCRREFSKQLFFNLFDRADLVSVFAEKINTQEKIRRFELLVGRKVDFENTVIFSDEVQESEDPCLSRCTGNAWNTSVPILCAGGIPEAHTSCYMQLVGFYYLNQFTFTFSIFSIGSKSV